MRFKKTHGLRMLHTFLCSWGAYLVNAIELSQHFPRLNKVIQCIEIAS